MNSNRIYRRRRRPKNQIFCSEMPINNEMERMLSSRQEQLVLCPAVNDQPFGGIVYVNGGSSIYTMSSNVEKSPLWHYI